MISGPIELDMQEETEIPSFLSGYSGTDLFDVDFVEAQLTTGETVKIVDYFSKGRSTFLGRVFLVNLDVMMEKTDKEGWMY